MSHLNDRIYSFKPNTPLLQAPKCIQKQWQSQIELKYWSYFLVFDNIWVLYCVNPLSSVCEIKWHLFQTCFKHGISCIMILHSSKKAFLLMSFPLIVPHKSSLLLLKKVPFSKLKHLLSLNICLLQITWHTFSAFYANCFCSYMGNCTFPCMVSK